jgi:predicted MFS family arabinose efflux permease
MSAVVDEKRSGPGMSAAIIVVVAGGLTIGAAMGVRQTFGLFLGPFSFDRGIPVTLFAFAVALHNLVWGVAQPFAGAAADRYSAAPVVAFGAIAFAAGMALAALAPSGVMLVLGMGLLVGIGISCTSFGVVMISVGQVASPKQRSMAMGLASAGGSVGQILIVPLAQGVTNSWGMTASLLVLAVLMLASAPLGMLLDRRDSPGAAKSQREVSGSLRNVLIEAAGHRGFCLLTIGFFTCGFQLAFIGTHLPGYLSLCHMPLGLGATALATIGFFNMIGSWGCGWLGGRFRQQHVLAWVYVVRGIAIGSFILLPTTEVSVLVFAAFMGLTWLGTVPLTSGLVAKIFGMSHLGTLFGICFLSHQVGSFLGAWLGGLVFDVTGSYSMIWIATALVSFVAALMHFPIDDRPAMAPVMAPQAAE